MSYRYKLTEAQVKALDLNPVTWYLQVPEPGEKGALSIWANARGDMAVLVKNLTPEEAETFADAGYQGDPKAAANKRE